MARKLKNFSFTKNESERVNRKIRYPWDQWLDGDVWELTPGKDFTISVASFRSGAFYNAKIRGMKIRTARKDDKLIIQAYKEKK